ncbi:COX15 [Candida oxycetoniae]|uniref:COX15 n=1 Tax=Candida oxycetoniae TaxID=497107 RepID=A0AAI9STU6_9ASCO|nr:COX15 [Candida oxycetoniae]KAI3402912.2 COX15 [Candida oxycetoniae]
MFSRSAFFFTRNSFILSSLARHPGCRPLLSAKHGPSSSLVKNFFGIFNHLKSKRSYSVLATAAAAEAKQAMLQKAPLKGAKTGTGPGTGTGTGTGTGKPFTVPSKSVGYWLVGTSTLIFGIVVLGGLTRLTESGLSITEWKPVTGALPPRNEQDWAQEFAKYKDSPEFKQLNSHLTLEDFKFIYYMEWSHRLVGRGIGLFFILPAVVFWARNRFTARLTKRVIGLTGLLGLQGAIGWWMVKSGLDEEQLAERKSKPTVSQYRLTTHLGAAFLMYLGVLYTAFEIFNENKFIKLVKTGKSEMAETILAQLNSPALKKTKVIATGLLVLTFITAMSGGMVAGLDAGLIYNTFPHMGDNWMPHPNELMSPIFARKEDKSDLWWRNCLENPTTVQLIHRIFATTTFLAVFAGHMYANRNASIIPRPANNMMKAMMGVVTLQFALGITTLIYLVPIPLAAAHQAGALALLTACLAFVARLKKPRPELVSYINNLMKQQLKKSNPVNK